MLWNYTLITKKETERYTNTQRLNNLLLNDEWVNNGVKEEIQRYLDINENENTKTPNLRNTTQAILREKIVVM